MNTNEDFKIWKYMPLEHFKTLLSSSALYFQSFEDFEDKEEGIPFTKNQTLNPQNEKNLRKYVNHKPIKNQLLLDCWHKNNNVCTCMWNNYSKGGVAIQSAIKCYKQSLERGYWLHYLDSYGQYHYPIESGVDYLRFMHIDYRKENEDVGSEVWDPFWTKLEKYKHENEFRILWNKELRRYKTNPLSDEEKVIKVNLNTLIEAIYCTSENREGIEMLLTNSNIVKPLFESKVAPKGHWEN